MKGFSTPPSKQTRIINNETVARGVIYCCVPFCKSYSGKIVEGKKVTIHKIPLDEKYKPDRWIQQIRNVRKDFAVKAGTRVCSLHFVGKRGAKPRCPFPTIFPSKQAELSLNILRKVRYQTKSRGPEARRRLNFDSGVQYNEKNALDFQHCFHDYLLRETFKPESGGNREFTMYDAPARRRAGKTKKYVMRDKRDE